MDVGYVSLFPNSALGHVGAFFISCHSIFGSKMPFSVDSLFINVGKSSRFLTYPSNENVDCEEGPFWPNLSQGFWGADISFNQSHNKLTIVVDLWTFKVSRSGNRKMINRYKADIWAHFGLTHRWLCREGQTAPCSHNNAYKKFKKKGGGGVWEIFDKIMELKIITSGNLVTKILALLKTLYKYKIDSSLKRTDLNWNALNTVTFEPLICNVYVVYILERKWVVESSVIFR